MTNSRNVLAYLAGVIDSDGTIGVRRNDYGMRVLKTSRTPIFAARVCCKQVTPQAIDLLKEVFGGHRSLQKASVTKGRPLHYWEVSNQAALLCLKRLLPHLRIKRPQAENCIALGALVKRSRLERCARGRGHAGAATRSVPLTAEMEAVYLRSKSLNGVGVGAT